MPFAVSFMASPLAGRASLLGRGARADLIVGAVAARLVARGGIEAPRPDACGGGGDGGLRLGEVALRRPVPAGQARLEEAQLDRGGQPPGLLADGERVDLELQALARAPVRRLRLGDVGGLVVDDHGAL